MQFSGNKSLRVFATFREAWPVYSSYLNKDIFLSSASSFQTRDEL